jgi:hypothetical protein
MRPAATPSLRQEKKSPCSQQVHQGATLIRLVGIPVASSCIPITHRRSSPNPPATSYTPAPPTARTTSDPTW